MDKKGNFEGWVMKAEIDFEAAKSLARSSKKGMADIVCYHCQQCVEKYLKAYLVLHRVSFPKTHDLEKLLELIKDYDALITLIRKDINFLSPYSVGIRYPGEVAARHEARSALKCAARAKDFIGERLGKGSTKKR